MAAPRRLRRRSHRSAVLHTTLAGRCPNCVFGDLFDGPLRARAACELCGLRFDLDGSNWLAAGFVVWVVAMVGLSLEGALLLALFGFFPGLTWVLGGSAVLIVAGAYRAARGLLVGCLWSLGYLDEGPGR